MTAKIIAEEKFNANDYSDEMRVAPDNRDVGTKLWFENPSLRVWEVRLKPGERSPFHAHTHRYFWTVVQGGTGRQRSQDGSMITREYSSGDTNYSEHSVQNPWLHDFENFGDTDMLFITVELLD
jgi:quercetin dioxygenase-like cupin family protein